MGVDRINMRKKYNRGFTTPELVIVIVVIAILAAVLIPSFIILATNQNSGEDSDPEVAADIALARNMNAVLAASETTPVSMSDLVVILENNGYRIDNLSPAEQGNVFLWNRTSNRISYIAGDGTVLYTEDVLPTVFTNSPEFWLTVRSKAEMEAWPDLSYYFAADITESLEFSTASSINTGNYTAGEVTYTYGEEASVTVEGTLSSLTVNAPYATVYNYSSVSSVTLLHAAADSYHESGYVRGALTAGEEFSGEIAIEPEGTVVELNALQAAPEMTIANSGYVLSLFKSTSVGIVNDGYIGNAAAFGLENAASITYSISNASGLSRLRDKINNGIRLENATYRLTADIDLSGSDWVPMGPETNPFTGTFDGEGHTINGLTSLCLFGYVGAGTTVRNIRFTNVSTILPPVAACVYGSVDAPTTFSGIEVNGTISSDVISVSGLVGILRSTETELPSSMKQSPEVIIENCTNNASASCVGYTRAAGFVVTVYGVSLEVRDCVNNGDLSVTNYTREAHAGGIVGFVMHNSLLASEAGDARCNNFTVTVKNCINNGAVSGTVGISANNFVGGIVAAANNGRIVIEGCANHGDVSSRNTAGGSMTFAGGVIGVTTGQALIRDCEISGSITATAERSDTDAYAGGVTGRYEVNPYNSGALELDSVLVSGNVSVSGQGTSAAMAGGLVGQNNSRDNRLLITECTVAVSVIVSASGAEENRAALVAGYSSEGALTIVSVTVAEGGTLVYGRDNSSFGLTRTVLEGGYARYEGNA